MWIDVKYKEELKLNQQVRVKFTGHEAKISTEIMDIRNLSNKEKKTLHIGSVRRSSYNWKFCNTELILEKGYFQEYRCPKCGSTSGLVNVIGLCATKVYK